LVDISELGRRIRKLRLERRLTLKQVEQASGLSATHLSEIERGRTSPTIGALVRIARALDKDASYFIEIDERAEVAHHTREKRRTVTPTTGVTVEVLTVGIPGSRMFAYTLQLAADPPATLEIAAQEMAGEALYYVRRGALSTQFGDTVLSLSTGDAAQATLVRSHRITALGDEPAEVIAILTHSLEEGRA